MLTYSGIVALSHGEDAVGSYRMDGIHTASSCGARISKGHREGNVAWTWGGKKLPHEFGVATGIRDDS